jgi:1-acyl-sn-glycerol-3-phosphate acyltransferase
MPGDSGPQRRATRLPLRGNPLTRAFGRLVMRLMGWRIEGALPDLPKAVIIVAPHTAAIDLVIGLAGKVALGVEVHWFGKHTVFWPPLGWLLRWLGGLPVDRAAPGGVARRAADEFARRERFLLGLSPEGTRRRVERWKTGFHRIAVEGGVPILPVALDYRSRTIRIRDAFSPTADVDADLARLRCSFQSGMARFPEHYAE